VETNIDLELPIEPLQIDIKIDTDKLPKTELNLQKLSSFQDD
jgi:hypothetical protein